ncbi:MAG: ABC transporter substrate-binding protein [Deltaproteobacteria bacterium]|nr:ABC transporter substrate-binding protein [Deltaproteobacteria bacterium]
MLDARNSVVLILGLALAILVSACGDPDAVRLGAILSIEDASGGQTLEGAAIRDGMVLAAREINSGQGIRGRKLVLDFRDCGSDPARARDLWAEMTAKGEPAAVIVARSHVALGLRPLAEAAEVPLLGVVTSAPELTANATWTFRYWPRPEDELGPIVDHVRVLGVETLGVWRVDSVLGRVMLDHLRRTLEPEGRRVLDWPFPMNAMEFSAPPTGLADTDGVLVVGLPGQHPPLYEALVRDEYGGVRLGLTSSAHPLYLTMPQFQGLQVSTTRIYSPRADRAASLKAGYEAMTGEAFTHFTAIGYDAVMLLAATLERNGLGAESLRNGLAGGFVFPGVFGDVVSTKGSHEWTFPLVPAHIENGRLVYHER